MIWLALGLLIVVFVGRVAVEHWHRTKWYSARKNELELSAQRAIDAINAAPLPQREPHAIVGALNHSSR